MKTTIHIDSHKVKNNRKFKTDSPVLMVKDDDGIREGHGVEILDKEGNVVVRIMYKPEKSLLCKNRVWIETDNEVRLEVRGFDQPNPILGGMSRGRG